MKHKKMITGIAVMLLLLGCVPVLAEEGVLPEDMPEQHMAPGASWDGAVYDYVASLNAVLAEAAKRKQNGEYGPDMVEEYRLKLQEAPMTLGPGNAALEKYLRWKQDELEGLLAVEHQDEVICSLDEWNPYVLFFGRLLSRFSGQVKTIFRQPVGDFGFSYYSATRQSFIHNISGVERRFIQKLEFSFSDGDDKVTLLVTAVENRMRISIGDADRYREVRRILYRETAQAPLAVTVDYDFSRPQRVGGGIPLAVTVTNMTDDIAEILAIAVGDDKRVPYVTLETGSAIHNEAEDCFLYDPENKTLTEFHTGLLGAGESKSATVTLTGRAPGDFTPVITVQYRMIPADDYPDLAYVPSPDAPAPTAPPGLFPPIRFIPVRQLGNPGLTPDRVIIRDEALALPEESFEMGWRTFVGPAIEAAEDEAAETPVNEPAEPRAATAASGEQQ